MAYFSILSKVKRGELRWDSLPPGPQRDMVSRVRLRRDSRCGLTKPTPSNLQTEAATMLTEAAQQGHMLAQLWLAELYESGHGLPVDLTQGFRWMHAAAVQGHADAQYEVGLAFEHGRGTNQSYAKAFEFYHRASLQGNPLATYSVGLLYESGCGVDADSAKAIEWYAISASQDARGGLPCWRSERSFTAEFV